MRRLASFMVVGAALIGSGALLVPASAGQIVSALTSTAAAGAPASVRPFPVLGGMGLAWAAPDGGEPPVGYEVERRRPSGNWAGESGRLNVGTTRWIDRNLQPDATVEYRVLAYYPDDQVIASDPVTAHRVAQDPAVGSIDILMVDADRGGNLTWLTDETAGPVAVSPLTDGTHSLSAGTLRFVLPGILAGPGVVNVDPDHAIFVVQQGERTCRLTGTLTVEQIAYQPDLGIATLSARFAGSCPDASSVAGLIRVDSTLPYAAVSVPPVVDFGQIAPFGSESKTATIKNTGLTTITVNPQPIPGSGEPWTMHDECSTLEPGESCPITLTINPQNAQDYVAAVGVYTNTPVRERHTIRFTASAVTSPSPPRITAAATLEGVDISWKPPFNGNSPITGYVLRRDHSGAVTTYNLPPDQLTWNEQREAGATYYTVAAVNDVAEGRESERTRPEGGWSQVTVFAGPTDQPAKLGALALPRPSQVVPMGTQPPAGRRADVAVTHDGSRIAYAVDDGSARSLSIRTRDENGPVTTKLLTAPVIRSLAWSPDGTRIAFTTSDGSSPCVDIIEVATRAVARVGCKFDYAAWYPDNRSLVVRDGRVVGARLARVEARAGGATLAALAGTAGATQTAVSPLGSTVAFVMPGKRIGLLPINGGTPAIVADVDPVAIDWSRSGTGLAVLTRSTSGDLLRVLPDAVANADYPQWDFVYATTRDEQVADFAWHSWGVTINPTPTAFGRSVSVPFNTTAVQEANTTCALDVAAPQPCTSPFTATGLSSGQHLLRVWASVGSYPNGYSAVTSRLLTVDATGPTTRISAPTYAASTAAATTVRYSATDSSVVVNYDVRYRRATYNGPFSAYAQPWTATTATSVTLSLTAGYEYCVSARARDKFGNVGAWSTERCFARPMDDRALTMATTGWARTTWSALYLNTGSQTGGYGLSLTRTVQGKRFYLVATKCPTCGLVSVYLGSRYIGAVNLYAATTQRQAVIALPAQSTIFSGTLKITTRSSGKLVQIDGLAVRRT